MASKQQTGKNPSRLPGYGWRPNLTGLEHPRQWIGVFLVVVALFVIALLITLAFG